MEDSLETSSLHTLHALANTSAYHTEACFLVRSHLIDCEAGMGVGGVGSWAAMVLAVCVLCGEAKRGGHHHTRQATTTSDTVTTETQDDLQVGRSLNLLPRYGFLTLSLKVFPHRSDNVWLFRERTKEVFQRTSYWASPEHQHQQQHQQKRKGKYDQHFLIDFCDNPRDLLIAYFDNFLIEGIPEPHRAFTASLSVKTLAQHLGLPALLLSDEYHFVLVRLSKRVKRSALAGELTITNHFKRGAQNMRVGSTESVHQFLDNFGTHVITEYEVGDVMYQVYVFGDSTYRELKSNFAVSQSQSELTRMERYFTPYLALHVGRVKLASGNEKFEKVVGAELMSMTFFRLYQNIFAIFKHQNLEDELEKLEGEVILSLKLEQITKIVPKSPERMWLQEVLDNILSLYYITM